MIPIVFYILKWEKELEIQRQNARLRGNDVITIEPAAPPRRKEPSKVPSRIPNQKPCESS